MKNILSLLDRFSKILDKDVYLKETIAQIILDKTKISLAPESFSLKEGVLQLNTSSVAKNEIRLKEETIISELKNHKVVVSRILYK